MGDGILVEFVSVVDAVSCAVAWQRGVAVEDLRFRIGINLGDVIAEDGDIYGNGVNVAARLELLSDPGGICLSANVHDEVRDKLDLAFQNMGAQTVKNIAEPIRAYRIVLDAAAPSKTPRPMTPHSGKPALAVLPFNNMSGEASQEGFADGMTEDIITALSRSYASTSRHAPRPSPTRANRPTSVMWLGRSASATCWRVVSVAVVAAPGSRCS